jgi:SAM-dependent methyltransferase
VVQSTLTRLTPPALARRAGPLAQAVFNVLAETRVAAATLRSEQTFRKLAGRRGLQIHLGCDDDVREGWVNIDLKVRRVQGERRLHPDTVLVDHDLRLGLPLAPESCDYIYSSHLLEHLEPHHGLRLLRDCFDALRPGGILRT